MIADENFCENSTNASNTGTYELCRSKIKFFFFFFNQWWVIIDHSQHLADVDMISQCAHQLLTLEHLTLLRFPVRTSSCSQYTRRKVHSIDMRTRARSIINTVDQRKLSFSQTFSLASHSTTEFFVFQQSFFIDTTFRLGNSGLLRVYVQAF